MTEQNQTQETQATEQKQPEKVRGDRGEVGQGSPGSRLKALWHAAGGRGSLKQFVKTLKDNADAKSWLANKHGKNNQKRTDANIKAALEARSATKVAKRKKKGEGGAK
jgi:hypothetical protein